MPRRRRGAATVMDDEVERGLAMRILLHSPKDLIAGALAFAAASAIIANALFLQAGRHPAPMFGLPAAVSAAGLTTASPLPRPRPAEADLPPSEPKLAEAKSSEAKPAELKLADPLTNLVKATSTPPAATSTIVRPPAPISLPSRNDTMAASGSRRVAAMQRALTELGYGQLKLTGTIGSDTQAAIQKFEREHKMPVTGQVSDRLGRELTAMIGHPLD